MCRLKDVISIFVFLLTFLASSVSLKFFLVMSYFINSLFKGTVIQIEKALTNDRLRVSKVS